MIRFTKTVATGNDFVIVDNRKKVFKNNLTKVAKELCDRKYGIGADGLLLLERSDQVNFKMRIFNPDGSEAQMCGNGSRCIALYAYKKKIASARMEIETLAGIVGASISEDSIKVKITEPTDIQWNIYLMINE